MEFEFDSKITLYLISEIIVAVFSALGNTLVTVTFLRDQSLRTPTNVFVFSLAVVDLSTSAVATPLYVRSMLTNLPHDFFACICVQSLILTFCTVSIFHLIAVSFDRYMAVVWRRKPVAHKKGMRRAYLFIGSAWILGIFIGCMPLMGWNAKQLSMTQIEQLGGLQKCEFLEVIDMEYLLFLFYATIIAPTAIMIFFYASIYVAVLKQNERMLNIRYSSEMRSSVRRTATDNEGKIESDSSTTLIESYSLHPGEKIRKPWFKPNSRTFSRLPSAIANFQKRQDAKSKKVIFSLALVILCFFISWYPLYVMNAVAYYCETCVFERWWFFAPIVLSHVSSAVNPLIYARTMPGYKEAFIVTLTCGKMHAKLKAIRSKSRRLAVLADFNDGTAQVTVPSMKTQNAGDRGCEAM